MTTNMEPTRIDQPARRPWSVRGMQWATRYLALSVLTLPFAGVVWLGELPLLVLIQLPKLAVAGWVRTDWVMPFMRWAGWSSGWFSPDYLLARPYALALVYLLPLLASLVWWRARGELWRSHRRVWFSFAAACVVDYGFTLAFGSTRALTIY